MTQGTEKVDSLDELDKEEERPDAHLRKGAGRGGCRPGLKAVKGTCVHKDTPINITLDNSTSMALNKVRDRLLNRQGVQ
jgi:hypothetical protein